MSPALGPRLNMSFAQPGGHCSSRDILSGRARPIGVREAPIDECSLGFEKIDTAGHRIHDEDGQGLPSEALTRRAKRAA